MSKKTILVIAPALLGIPVLFWATLATRGEQPAPLKSPKPTVRRTVATADRSEETIPAAAAPNRERGARPSATYVSPETAAIQERVRLMEERLRELEARRDQLAADNKDLEKQSTEKWAEMTARSTAEWKVKSWEKLLGLGETQKQSLIDLMTKWGREDGGRPAGRDAWAGRETDLRSQLTAEQAAKLHDSAANQSQQQWKLMAVSIGSMIGASRDDLVRLQQSLGDLEFPQNMILPEAYGVDWSGMMREAAVRARPVLTADQTAKLDKFGYK